MTQLVSEEALFTKYYEHPSRCRTEALIALLGQKAYSNENMIEKAMLPFDVIAGTWRNMVYESCWKSR